MSVWFDQGKSRWVIRIKRGGNDVGKILPKGSTEEQAQKLHDLMMREVVDGQIAKLSSIEEARNDAISHELAFADQWGQEVARAKKSSSSWMRNMIYSSGSRSRKNGVDHTLSIDELENICLRSKGRCEVTGLRFSLERPTGTGKRLPFQPSLDRKDSSKGYSVENCRLVCWAVNAAMGPWGEDVFRKLAVGLFIKEHGFQGVLRRPGQILPPK